MQPATVGLTTIKQESIRVPEARAPTAYKVKQLVGSDVMHQLNKKEFENMHESTRVPAREQRVGTYLSSSSMGGILTGGDNVIGIVEPKGKFPL